MASPGKRRRCNWNARHRPYRHDPDRPLNPVSEALSRLVNENRFMRAWAEGVRGDELVAVAIPCIVDEFVDGALSEDERG